MSSCKKNTPTDKLVFHSAVTQGYLLVRGGIEMSLNRLIVGWYRNSTNSPTRMAYLNGISHNKYDKHHSLDVLCCIINAHDVSEIRLYLSLI